jgi:MFS family permease
MSPKTSATVTDVLKTISDDKSLVLFNTIAHNISTLLALIVLQGVAVASTPISTKLIRDQVPKTKFPVGISIYLSAYSGGMALGAVLGPVVAANSGWQGNFYFIAPIVVVLSFVCWRFIHSD